MFNRRRRRSMNRIRGHHVAPLNMKIDERLTLLWIERRRHLDSSFTMIKYSLNGKESAYSLIFDLNKEWIITLLTDDPKANPQLDDKIRKREIMDKISAAYHQAFSY